MLADQYELYNILMFNKKKKGLVVLCYIYFYYYYILEFLFLKL